MNGCTKGDTNCANDCAQKSPDGVSEFKAAIACAHTMGLGDWRKSDQAAVETMRKCMDDVPINGTIVIGEGERDEAPMLYIGEKVGLGAVSDAVAARLPAIDIAVDPLEGTNLCATGAPNAIVVLAASNRGGLLHAPDLYMQKLVVGPTAKDSVDLDASVHENLSAIAKSLERDVEEQLEQEARTQVAALVV